MSEKALVRPVPSSSPAIKTSRWPWAFLSSQTQAAIALSAKLTLATMQFFTAIIALAVAAAANAASTPVRRSSPPTTLPTEPGIFTFRNDHCGYDDAQSEGDFVPYSSLDKYCTQTGLFHSYINYTPDGGPLPYDVSSDTPICCRPAPYTHALGICRCTSTSGRTRARTCRRQ
jgi:hypothetical protein